MLLTQAEGKNFRNYREFSLSLPSKISVFMGRNGHGKSSLLEAIFAGFRGRSFRPSAADHFIKSHETEAFVKLILQESHGGARLEAFFSRNPANIQAGPNIPPGGPSPLSSASGAGENIRPGDMEREILYCGKKAGLSFLEKTFPVFVFTEEKMRAIRQGPQERRLWADDMLLAAGKRKDLSRLKKSLREKSSLLKSLKQGAFSPREARRALLALNEAFLKAAAPVAGARLEILENLFAAARRISEKFFPGPEDLDFEYLIAGENMRENPQEIPRRMEKDLEEKREREIQAGRPLSGPQKHDIVFLLNGRDSRAFCSKGQQRLLIFSLIGCQVQRDPRALLFLDDALGELDMEGQKKFLRFLEEAPCQTLLTSCGPPPAKTKNMSFFSVNNGKIISL